MSLFRRLEKARQAFARGDVQAATAAHALGQITHAAGEEHGGAGEQYIGDMVYGGLDGIITTFAVISGVAGAELGTHVVLILGLANLFADGLAMATGAYLSGKSEQEYYERELQRETWEVAHLPDAERAELYEIYRRQGYSDEEVRRLVEIKTRDPERWIKAMMVEELGMLENERKPPLSALATLVSFIVAGSVPLLVYLLGLITPVPSGVAFPVSIGLSAVALFGLGAAKVLVTRLNAFRSGLEMLVVGGLAAGVAYLVGAWLKGIGG
ncbi:MAG: VIT1/CCC1 transporter family protein [Armatimonadetes bacterium]|nr:VIT1/CCC1 transporter family protein [Armatimonadota bacterium]